MFIKAQEVVIVHLKSAIPDVKKTNQDQTGLLLTLGTFLKIKHFLGEICLPFIEWSQHLCDNHQLNTVSGQVCIKPLNNTEFKKKKIRMWACSGYSPLQALCWEPFFYKELRNSMQLTPI